MIWALLVGLAVAKPTGQEMLVPGIGTNLAGPLSSGTITLTLDVAMTPVDGVPMSSARRVNAEFVLGGGHGQTFRLSKEQNSPSACRFRLPLAGPWAADAAVQVKVVLTGDELPMELKPHLPEGAVKQEDIWLLIAPKGDLVVDLPACG